MDQSPAAVPGTSTIECRRQIVAVLPDARQRPLPIGSGHLPRCDRRANRAVEQSADGAEPPDATIDGECPVDQSVGRRPGCFAWNDEGYFLTATPGQKSRSRGRLTRHPPAAYSLIEEMVEGFVGGFLTGLEPFANESSPCFSVANIIGFLLGWGNT